MKSFEITKIEDLINKLLNYKSHWIFRGQRDSSWGLTPGIERMFVGSPYLEEFYLAVERKQIAWFLKSAHHYAGFEDVGKHKLEILSLMQHHGIPTRLIDFTLSPFVALFFAVDDFVPIKGKKFSIWCVNFREIMKISGKILYKKYTDAKYAGQLNSPELMFDEINSKGSNLLWVGEQQKMNLRLHKQQGTFLFQSKLDCKFSDGLSNFIKDNDDLVHKYDIPSELYFESIEMLAKMSINHASIYPGIDGFCKQIRTQGLMLIEKGKRGMASSK